jgi:hypothetical protein
VSAVNELLGPEHGRGMSEAVLRQLSGSLAEGLSINFWLMAATALLAFGFSFFFPRVKAAAKPASDGAMMH